MKKKAETGGSVNSNHISTTISKQIQDIEKKLTEACTTRFEANVKLQKNPLFFNRG
jgi:hypothetical protein